MGVQAMKSLRSVLVTVILLGSAGLVALPASAQRYYPAYRPYSYRSMSRTGTYHGYWRDLGYGATGHNTNGYYLPPPDYYYGGRPVYPAPYYYRPAPQPYGYR